MSKVLIAVKKDRNAFDSQKVTLHKMRKALKMARKSCEPIDIESIDDEEACDNDTLKDGKPRSKKSKHADSQTSQLAGSGDVDRKYPKLVGRVLECVKRLGTMHNEDFANMLPADDGIKELLGEGELDESRLAALHNVATSKINKLGFLRNYWSFVRGKTYQLLMTKLQVSQEKLELKLKEKDINLDACSQRTISVYLRYVKCCEKYPPLIFLDIPVHTLMQHSSAIMALERNDIETHESLKSIALPITLPSITPP